MYITVVKSFMAFATYFEYSLQNNLIKITTKNYHGTILQNFFTVISIFIKLVTFLSLTKIKGHTLGSGHTKGLYLGTVLEYSFLHHLQHKLGCLPLEYFFGVV